MPVKEALACIGVLGVSLLLVGFTFAPATASLSGSPAMRTWFFHNQLSNSGWTYAMNETSPKLHTDDRSEGLGFFYFGPKSGSSLYDQTRTGFNLTFALAPGYPYGFDLIPGTALLDLWMQGQGGYNFPPTKLYAQFNFTLSGPTEQTLGTTLATLVLQANSANSISPWNHTSVPLPIALSTFLTPSSQAHLNITWLNPPSGYDILMGFDSTPAHPASISVPANYYTSNLTLLSNGVAEGDSIRLAQTVSFAGSLTNFLNGSSIPDETVTIVAHPQSDWQHPFLLGSVVTNATGGYDLSWSTSDPAFVGAYQVIASWTGNSHYSAASSSPGVGNFYVGKARTVLSLVLSIPAAQLGLAVTIHGTLTGLSGPIAGATVFLSYNVPGTSTWTTLTSSQTDSTGIYNAEWIPQATGNFTLRASWSGNAMQDPGESKASLTSLASSGSGTMWIGSPTPAVGSSFNSVTHTLTFSLSPPTFAGSLVTLYIPKSISHGQPNGPLAVGGKTIAYSVENSGTAWIISFSIPQDSSGELQVAFGPIEVSPGGNSSQQNLLPLIPIPVVAAIIAFVLLLLRKRKHSVTPVRY